MIKINKEVYGHGKPIVLIHGWGMHTGIWRIFAQQLAQYYQVTCLDLPGHGLSESVEPYTLEEISTVLISALPKEPVCLLGWSLGATVALTMAKNYPQQVNSLILLAGNPKFIQNGDWAGVSPKFLDDFTNHLSANSQLILMQFLALQVTGLPNGQHVLKELKQAIAECDPPVDKVLLDGLKILKNEDLRDDLVTLNCPITLIQGDKDALIPVQVSQNVQKIKPECEVNIVSGAGHVPFLSHQSKLMEIIKQFV